MNNKIDLPTVEIVLLCMESLVKNRKKCSFGELIKECFKLYPSVFALTDVPKWPDTLKLDRALRGLREKGYISGSPVTYYTITNLGYRVLDSLKYKVYGNTIGQEIRSTRSPDRRSSRRNSHKPTSAPMATMTPKLVTSKSPIREEHPFKTHGSGPEGDAPIAGGLKSPIAHYGRPCFLS